MAQPRNNPGTGRPSGPPSEPPSTRIGTSFTASEPSGQFNYYFPPYRNDLMPRGWMGPEYISYSPIPSSTTSNASSTIYTPRSSLYLNGRKRGALGTEAVLRARLDRAFESPSQSSNSSAASPVVLTPTSSTETSAMASPVVLTPTSSTATSAMSSPGVRTPTTSATSSSISSPVVLMPTTSTVSSTLSSPTILTPTASTVTSPTLSPFGVLDSTQTLVSSQYAAIPGDNEGLLRQLRECGIVENRPTLTTLEKETRLLNLMKLEDLAVLTRRMSSTHTGGLFRKACSTDLMFLIDTTGSMQPYMESVKAQVRNILDEISGKYLNQAEIRIGVVGYKDHGDQPHIQFLDFTPSIETVWSFLDTLQAHGGDDGPEDVLGGLQQTLKANWRHQTRVVMHIADSPPHGRTLHCFHDSSDNYPDPGSEPHRLTYRPLMKQLLALRINYILLRITDHTDRMAYAFMREYSAAGGDCMLSKQNVNYDKVMGGPVKKGSVPTGGLLFREDELGISYSALQRLVVDSVTSSSVSTATRTISSRDSNESTSFSKVNDSRAVGSFGLPPALEAESASRASEIKLEADPAQWHNLQWFDETISAEGFSIGATFNQAQGNRYGAHKHLLDRMIEFDRYCTTAVFELKLRVRKTPFAKGALRLASFARTEASTSRFVVKTFKHKGQDSSCRRGLARLAQDMRSQALCKAFALEFNLLLGDSPEYAIDFLISAFFSKKGNIRGSGGGMEYMSIEPFLDGKFVKYNGNSGYVNKDPWLVDNPSNQAAQAFSHFTFERSRGQLLVCDLQGVGGMMTDPAVHTADSGRFSLSGTNLGREGFMFFFAFHECNHVCRRLGLKTNGKTSLDLGGSIYTQLRDYTMPWDLLQKFTSRSAAMRPYPDTGYPDTGSVCCSNKLCGKMLFQEAAAAGVRKTRAWQHLGYPSYRWCDECLPQLDQFNVKRTCTIPGPGRQEHEFTVSRFLYESQGERLPLHCPQHKPDESALPWTVGGWW